ncbi:hypothetical protein L484_021947 [Morus notabilis]|uniref:Uncharacterized protein n=1 Tax=Morus notabilis TaxID=981085 RepID=W9QMB0_9ROSA|nr:hypothetical protein L484_021947 [Morus notabilis]
MSERRVVACISGRRCLASLRLMMIGGGAVGDFNDWVRRFGGGFFTDGMLALSFCVGTHLIPQPNKPLTVTHNPTPSHPTNGSGEEAYKATTTMKVERELIEMWAERRKVALGFATKTMAFWGAHCLGFFTRAVCFPGKVAVGFNGRGLWGVAGLLVAAWGLSFRRRWQVLGSWSLLLYTRSLSFTASPFSPMGLFFDAL